jgi:hypothetical protein
MNREATINHLILQGYVPLANIHGWTLIWNGETGRMCKFFDDGLDGPGWDVRAFHSAMATFGHDEVPWQRVNDEVLAQLTVDPLPPKYRHDFGQLIAQHEVDL